MLEICRAKGGYNYASPAFLMRGPIGPCQGIEVPLKSIRRSSGRKLKSLTGITMPYSSHLLYPAKTGFTAWTATIAHRRESLYSESRYYPSTSVTGRMSALFSSICDPSMLVIAHATSVSENWKNRKRSGRVACLRLNPERR